MIFSLRKLMSIARSIYQKDTYLNLQKCDILLVCHDHDLGLVINKKAYSPIVDSMFEALEKNSMKCQRFALPFSILTGTKASHHPSSANRRMLFFKILSKFKRLFNQPSNLEEKFYVNLFKTIECQCVMGIGLDKNVCNAAKEAGVLSIELLHGFGLPEFPNYLKRQYLHAPPQGIISFDDKSTKTYTDSMGPTTKIIEMKPIWLNTFLDSPVYEPLYTKEFSKKILITLQWGYDNDHPAFDTILDNGILSDALIKAIEHSGDEIFWRLRLHPVQLRNTRYKHHIKFIDDLTQQYKNCEWKDSSLLPLPQLLQHCDGHISMISGSAYDAALFGIPSLLLCPTLQKGQIHDHYFTDLIASHMATLGNMIESDILTWVAKTHQRDKKSSLVTNPTAISELVSWIKREKRPF